MVKSELQFWLLSTIRLPKLYFEFQWLLAGILLAPWNLTIWPMSQIDKLPTVTPTFSIRCRHINSWLPWQFQVLMSFQTYVIIWNSSGFLGLSLDDSSTLLLGKKSPRPWGKKEIADVGESNVDYIAIFLKYPGFSSPGSLSNFLGLLYIYIIHFI